MMYSVKTSFYYTLVNCHFIRPKIWHLSIEKVVNIYEVLIDPDREENSVSIELIFVYSKLDFDELLREKLIFSPLRKCFKCFLVSN